MWGGGGPRIVDRQLTCVKSTDNEGTFCHCQYGGDISPHGCKTVVTIQYHIPTWQLTKQGEGMTKELSLLVPPFLRNEVFPAVPQQMCLYILSA